MESDEQPLIEFPCDFTVKAMALTEYDAVTFCEQTVRRHLPHQQDIEVSLKSSSGGKYQSVTFVLKAENREQIDNVYRDLHANDAILMTL